MPAKPAYSTLIKLLLLAFTLSACDKFQDKSKPPQIQDTNSVGCLIANDFYAVHFSAYIKPTGNIQALKESEREALLQPYCQEIPKPGMIFFTADLIDRDVRKTPVGVKIIELEQTGPDTTKIDNFKELKILAEEPAKAHPQGVVEAHAEIPKNGYYAMILLVGGEEALSEEDQLKVLFHVGEKPFSLSKQMLIYIGGGVSLLLVLLGAGIWWFKKRKTLSLTDHPAEPRK